MNIRAILSVTLACLILLPAMFGQDKPVATSSAGSGQGGLAGPATATASKPAGDPAEIDGLIKQLGSENFAQREAAQQSLVKIGLPAMAPLQAATQDKDPERAGRARIALKQVQEAVFKADVLARIGKVTEITLKSPEVDRSAAFIDFETGKTVPLPANIDPKDRNGISIRKWADENGVDAMADTSREIRGLLGFGLVPSQSWKITDKDWDTAETWTKANAAVFHAAFLNDKFHTPADDPGITSILTVNTISVSDRISWHHAAASRRRRQ